MWSVSQKTPRVIEIFNFAIKKKKKKRINQTKKNRNINVTTFL